MESIYWLSESPRADKKWSVRTPAGKTIHFGARGYEDYTIHKDERRKESYIARHASRENWTSSGINTAGFWSRWLLWNKETLEDSIDDIERKFGIRIEREQ